MCMQCMAGAMSAGAAATGMRAWLVAHAPSWLTPQRRKTITRVLLGGALLLASALPPAVHS